MTYLDWNIGGLVPSWIANVKWGFGGASSSSGTSAGRADSTVTLHCATTTRDEIETFKALMTPIFSNTNLLNGGTDLQVSPDGHILVITNGPYTWNGIISSVQFEEDEYATIDGDAAIEFDIILELQLGASSATNSVTQFQRIADIPTPVVNSAGLTYNGLIYVFGGFSANGNDVKNTIQVYDPNSNTWSYACNMVHARRETAVALYDNKIYIFGGHSNDSGGLVTSYEVFDPNENTCTELGTLPSGMQGANINAVLLNNLVYLMWEYNLFTFDPTSLTFTQKATIPAPVVSCDACYMPVNGEDRIYILGGTQFGDVAAFNTVAYYIPSTDTWVNLAASCPYPEGDFTNICYHGNMMYGFGGNPKDTPLNLIYFYDPVSNSWSSPYSTGLPSRGTLGISLGGYLYIISGSENVDVDATGVPECDRLLLSLLDSYVIGSGSCPGDTGSGGSGGSGSGTYTPISIQVSAGFRQPVTYVGQSIVLGQFAVNWDGDGKVYLASAAGADPSHDLIWMDDQVYIQASKGQITQGYHDSGLNVTTGPDIEITNLLSEGNNTVWIVLQDVYGTDIGCSSLYLIQVDS